MAAPSAAVSLANLLEMWNSTITFPLTEADLTTNIKPALVMGALLEILTVLGFDRDAILAMPPDTERDEHTEYYWDLIPVMNVTRAVKHILPVIANGVVTFTMMNILAPTPAATQSMLLFLLNYVFFNRACREAIIPFEEEIFQHHDQVTALEQERDKLQELLNEQAAAKASRAMRLEKLEEDKKLLSDELKKEKRYHEEEVREWEQVQAQNRELEAQLEQRKAQKEALLVELARVRAQKVNDAEDIKSQHEQAVRNEKESIEKVNALREMLVSKETTVRNLLNVNAKVEEGIHYVMDITNLTDKMKELSTCVGREQEEVGSAVSERESELADAQAQLGELQRERRALHEQRELDNAAAKLELTRAHAAQKEMVAKCKKSEERSLYVSEIVQQKKKALEGHLACKQRCEQELDDIQTGFYAELKSFQDHLIERTKEATKAMEYKLDYFGK